MGEMLVFWLLIGKKTNSRHGQLSVAEKPVGNISRTIHRVDPPRAWMVDDPPDCA